MKNPKPFTIIELLVVIAIIAILASLLMPALQTAKEKGRTIVCASKMSQAGKAVMLYLTDNNDWLLPCYQKSPSTTWWTKNIGEYMGGSTQYGAKGEALACPSRGSELYGPTGYNTNYAYNTRCGNEIDMVASPSYGYVKISRVRFPGNALLITDHRNVTFNAIKWDQALFSANQIDRRHSNGANYLFVDGHVKCGKDIKDTTPCDQAGYYWARWANSPGQ